MQIPLKYNLLIVVLLYAGSIHAQKQGVNFDRIGVHQGLPEGFITDITQDNKGYIWIGSFEGLYKYDGTNVMPADRGTNNIALTTNRIYDIEEDKDGNLWVGTYIGLNKIELRTGKITRYTNIGSGSRIMPGNMVEHVFADSDNNIWIDTDGGFAGYNRDADTFIKLKHSDISYFSYCLFEDSNKTLWAGTNIGLMVIDKATMTLKGPVDTTLYAHTGSVYEIYKDRQGNIWLCTAMGLWWFAPGNMSLHRPSVIPKQYQSVRSANMLHDVNGNYWVASADSLLMFAANTGRVEVYKQEPDNAASLSGGVRKLYEDNNGNIWIGTTVGVNKINPATRSFNFYRLSPAEIYNHPANHVQRVHQRPDGSMFYATRTGLYRSAAPGAPVVQVRNTGRKAFLEHFFEAPGGQLWIAYSSPGRGIWRYNSTADSIEPAHIDDDIDNMGVYSIRYDIDTPHILWISTVKGLYTYYTTTGKAVRVVMEGSVNVPYPIVRWFEQMPSGIIWMDAGIILVCYDKRTGKVSEYPQKEGDTSGPGTRVRKILRTADGKLWIAFETGLSCYDEQTGKFTNYTTSNGLRGGNIVYDLQADSHGNIWFATFNYITRYDPRQNKFSYFSEADGIHTTFNRASSAILTDGSLAFGGANGLVVFHPDSIKEGANHPPVIITNISVGNKAYNTGVVPEYLDEVVLSYSDKVISFSFKTLEYVADNRNGYAYKLEGFDKDWIYAGTENKATYTNLDPGEYRFLIKTTNYQGSWSDKVAAIGVVVKPLFWQQWWFRLLAVSLFVALGYYIWRGNYEKKRYRQQKELAEQNDRYKTQFLSNVSHEIRTPLNAIIGLNKLLLDTPLDERQHKYVYAATQSSETLLTLINDLLDQAKIESGKFQFARRPFRPAQVVQQVCDTFAHKATEKDLYIKTNLENLPPVVLGDATRLHQVLSNLVSNAIKFTEKGYVQVDAAGTSLESNKASLRFEVKDTGIGIESNKLEKIFDSFHQVDNQLVYANIGTGLGLSISKQLVEQQDGKITVSSEWGKGSAFSFTLVFDLPAQGPDDVQQQDVEPVMLERLQILLVEDTPFNQLLAMEILKKNMKNVKVTLAENGKEAIDILEKEKVFDLVLLDVKMPVMNGYDTSIAIRAMDDAYYKHLPIVALTANAVPAQLEKCRQAGMDACVTKPIDAGELLKTIKTVLHKSDDDKTGQTE